MATRTPIILLISRFLASKPNTIKERGRSERKVKVGHEKWTKREVGHTCGLKQSEQASEDANERSCCREGTSGTKTERLNCA